jgi:hypothetical protein
MIDKPLTLAQWSALRDFIIASQAEAYALAKNVSRSEKDKVTRLVAEADVAARKALVGEAP